VRRPGRQLGLRSSIWTNARFSVAMRARGWSILPNAGDSALHTTNLDQEAVGGRHMWVTTRVSGLAVLAGAVLLVGAGAAIVLATSNKPAKTAATSQSTSLAPSETVPTSQPTPSALNETVPTSQPAKRPTVLNCMSPHITPANPTPLGIVDEFFAAINERDWPAVWQLGGRYLGYGPYTTCAEMIQGYLCTSHDSVTSITANRDVVTGSFVANEAYKGVQTQQTFQFRFTVLDGAIREPSEATLSAGVTPPGCP
jgi:hypothetical protein